MARLGEESSAPLWRSSEKAQAPSLGGSRAADGQAAAQSCQGCIISLPALGSDTHGGEEPLPQLAPSSLCPDFFAAAAERSQATRAAASVVPHVDCLRLLLPFDTDVLGCVLPCAPDFPLYMQHTIKTFQPQLQFSFDLLSNLCKNKKIGTSDNSPVVSGRRQG